METRALAIAFFYAVGTAIGGITGPLLFGQLIETGVDRARSRSASSSAPALMADRRRSSSCFFGVEAEQVQLEDIAKPISVHEAEEGDNNREAASR